MSITFITANAHNNNIMYCGVSIPFFPDHNTFTTIVDDTDLGIADLINNVNSHKFDEVMIGKPYINVYYDEIQIIGTIMNTSTMPTEVTISMLGISCKCPIINGQFIFPITFHPSVVDRRINVTLKIEGFPYTCLEIGGSNGNIETQIYQDSTGKYHVVPLKSTDLANYWQNKLVDPTWSQVDLATITGLVAHTLFNYVLPNLQLNLTPEEQSGLLDIQNTILPSIASTLENIKPNDADIEIHYASYRYHMQKGKQAMDNYVVDRNEISKYTTLK